MIPCMQADFSFFFDTGGRRRCYLAPERFQDASQLQDPHAPLQPSMVCSGFRPCLHLSYVIYLDLLRVFERFQDASQLQDPHAPLQPSMVCSASQLFKQAS